MQLIQLLEGPTGRRAALERSRRRRWRPAEWPRLAIVEGTESVAGQADEAMLPDVRERDGWVYSSLPLDVVARNGQLEVRRLRQTVSPARQPLKSPQHTDVLDVIDAATLEQRSAPSQGWHPRGGTRWRSPTLHVGHHHRPPGAGGLMELRLLALYPDQMNIYADRGNILFLQRRCEWRGIGFAYAAAGPGEGLDPAGHDLIYIGGGQDRDQRLVAADMLATKRDGLAAAVDDDAVVLAVCGGYQLLGHSYQLGSERIDGLGLADLETVRGEGERLIGNVAIEVDLGDGAPLTVAGFENHGGRTRLGHDATPLGRVLKGYGNNGEDGLEGVRRRNMFGTYLHGPLLPKNSALADHLIALALSRREGAAPELQPLDDSFERAAHASARSAAGVG